MARPRAAGRLHRHPGRRLLSSRDLQSFLFVAAVCATSCGGSSRSSSPTQATPAGPVPRASTSAPSVVAQPAPSAAQVAAPDTPREVKLLFSGTRDPSIGHPEILAVDAAGRRAFVRKSDGDHHKLTIETVDLATRRVVDTWQNDARHPIQAFGFARLAFQPLTADRSADLVRYGAIAAHGEERKLAVPTVSVSRDRSRIAYLVIAPPIMQVAVADAQGKNERRIGTARMRGYDPSLSPDGRWVAFSACAPDATSNDCARSLYVADLEAPRPTPRKLDVPWPAEVPSWDDDSRGLWTTRMVARERARLHTDEARSCLQHVDVVEGRVEELVCAEGAYDTEHALAPNRRTAVFVTERGEPPGLAHTIRICDLVDRRCGEDAPIPMLVGPPLLTDDGYVVSAGYLGLPWAIRADTGRHGTLRASDAHGSWYGRAVRDQGPHGFAWLALGSFAAKEEGAKDTPTFAIWGLDASALVHAGPPVRP